MTQQITVFQQNGSGESKIKGIGDYGNGLFSTRIISIDTPLPVFIDDSEPYLPAAIQSDLVLDFLTHPDLSYDLALRCRDLDIPVVASQARNTIARCGDPAHLMRTFRAGRPGQLRETLWQADLDVCVKKGRIERLAVTRGAPCGATWVASAQVVGMPVEEAIVRIGLTVQFFCVADPAGWDPIHGKSPVHFAGKVHASALRQAIGG